MFENVKKITVTPATTVTGRRTRPSETIQGWEVLSALDAVSKAVTGLLDFHKNQVKETVREKLTVDGLQARTKPESLSPVEGEAKGSAYLSKRSTNSALTEDEVALVTATVGEEEVERFVTTVEVIPSMLTINPEYLPGGSLYNEEKMRVIEELLAEEAPDFIVRASGTTRTVVAENALVELFRKPANIVETLLPVLATVAVRPVFQGAMEKAWELIRPLIPESAPARGRGR